MSLDSLIIISANVKKAKTFSKRLLTLVDANESLAAWAVLVRVPSQFGAEEAAGTGPTPIKQIKLL